MKQIEFTLEAFGPDGMLKDVYELVHPKQGKVLACKLTTHNSSIGVLLENGNAGSYFYQESNFPLILYRRPRTAEEVAREVREKWRQMQANPKAWTPFDEMCEEAQRERIDAVQAGMDEMR
jgi:hypothetical protein